MLDDPIARRARVLFVDRRRGKGNVAGFRLSQLESIMYHSHARGRREMALQCAEAVRTGAAASDGVHFSTIAHLCDRWAKEAEAEERYWR